jgi:MFS family permease
LSCLELAWDRLVITMKRASVGPPSPGSPSAVPERVAIMTPTFAVVSLAAMLFWFGLTTVLPVLPRFIRDELGGGDAMVGLVVGSLAIGAIIARPQLGRLGDTRGRRLLLVGGGAVASLAMLGHLLVTTTALLFALRILLGLGQAAFMVGMTTMVLDLAPEERRGEATAYTLVVVHFGIGLGPLFGEWVFTTWSFDAVWIASATTLALCGALAAFLPAKPAPSTSESLPVPPATRARILHPAGLMPGVVLGVGLLGWVGYNAFVPLFGEEIGVNNIAPVYLISSITVVLVRLVGARLPDQLGPINGGTVALVLMASGLVLIGLWRTAPGLYLGAFVLAIGSALLFPSLVNAAVERVPVSERSSAMATFTLFIDVSSALGVVLFGAIAAASSYGAAFVVGGLLTAVAVGIVRSPGFVRSPAAEEAT